MTNWTGRRTRISRQTAAVVATFGVLAALLMPVPAAAAPGDLDVTVQIVDNPGGLPVTELRASISNRSDGVGSLMGLEVGYSCGPVTCAAARIVIAPMQLDPYYGTYRFAAYSSATLPAGATISGSATAGYTIELGTVASGYSASFRVLYNFQSRPVGVSPQSFFPDGFIVTPSATISATGLDPVTGTTSVPWRIDTPEPAVNFDTTRVARVDQDYTYTDFMSARCLWERTTAGHGEPVYECAESYEVAHTLPPGAVFVSASHGGAYDGAGTVTWAGSGASAASGWGSLNNLGTPRTVTVRFPQSMFTDPDQCVISVTTSLHVDMTYLSGAVDSADATRSHDVNACTPFAAGGFSKFAERDAGTAAAPIVWESSSRYWETRVVHRSNVPAVATIVDDDLDQAGLPVTRISLPSAPGTITATLDNGATATVTGTVYNAPSGRRIVAATVVSSTLAGPNQLPSDTSQSVNYSVRYHYTVAAGVPDEGYQRTNTASASLEFPGTPELSTYSLGSSAMTVTVLPRPAVLTPRLTRTVVGGGNPVAGTVVQYGASAETSYQDPAVPYQPQYVFVAPALWEIIPGSASIPGVADAVIEYKTVTIAGESREAVFVTRPAGTVWGINGTWPTLNVNATPGAGAAASSTGRATFYMGDAAHNYSATTALWGSNNSTRFVDAPDLDGDGVTTESYAYVNADTVVGAASALQVLKEICLPDSSAADGCDWLSDPARSVGVAPTTTDIGYRVTIRNGGSTPLTNVVAYDVLPYIGDTGTSAGSASTSRGSTFAETLDSVDAVASGLTLTYSGSTNPCRAEVYASAPGCVDDWGGTIAGAQSIRAAVTGTLTAGQSVSFTYLAAVTGSPAAGALACNSVAVASATTPAAEPRPVCAVVEAADLAIEVPDRLPLQAGRPGIVPFEVTHLSGTASAFGSVAVDVPAGLTVTSLTPSGWSCSAPTAAPVAGAARLECTPVDSLGDTRAFSVGVTELLELPVIPAAAAASLCVPAEVSGSLSDPVLANNDASACFTVLAGRPALEVSKTDARTTVAAGEDLTYTISVANLLAGETVTAITVTDTLPDGLVFVSASDGGVVSGRNADDGFGNLTGGQVTWTVASLGGSGVVDADGSAGTGASGSVAEVTVTVRVAPRATGTITNVVTASATDPADPAETLDASAEDIDDVTAAAAPTVTKTVTSLSQATDGSWTVEYSIVVANSNTLVPVDYDLADTTAFGSGMTASSVTLTTTPAGVTILPWTGSGAVASDVVLAASTNHTYVVTAEVDAGTTPGTAAAQCLANAAAGFANTATLTLHDASTVSSTACASPVEPSLEKAMIGAPVHNADATWTVSYSVTVSNPHAAPTGGLAYTLTDALSFPSGIAVQSIDVTAPTGVTANTAFTGGLASVDGVAVTADSDLVDGVARIAAGTVGTPSTHEYRVDVIVIAAEGSVDDADLACGAPGAGYGNRVSLSAGSSSTVLAESSACADIALPALRFTKTVDRIDSAIAGTQLTYTITAANVGDADFTTADPAELTDDMTDVLDDGRFNGAQIVQAGGVTYAAPVLHWSGPIAAGASVMIRYTVDLHAELTGDGSAINSIARTGATLPSALPACGGDATASDAPCAVTLTVTRAALALTGAESVQLRLALAVSVVALGALVVVTARALRTREEPFRLS